MSGERKMTEEKKIV
jgi:hypothetical protein